MNVPYDSAGVAHRPWPVPERRWSVAMRWLDLAFLHWRVDADALRALLPPTATGLTLDTYGGEAWLGVVPFRMEGVRPRWAPALPGVSAFPEINLRTYATAEGKPGVWFFSLDVPSHLAVRVARGAFHLPYFRARMRVARRGDQVRYESVRLGDAARGTFAGRYGPRGPRLRAEPGSLEHWLTERYCLYAADPRGRVLRCDVHHAPWPLQPGEARVEACSLPALVGLDPGGEPPLVHFADRLDVVAWGVRPVG